MGVSSALIYTPGFYAKTDELIALSKVASEYGGMYISHMRSEGNRLLEAIDELMTIARDAKIRAEIYHLKAAGESNWGKLDQVIAKVEGARKDGLEITADMYTYTAGSTGLDAAMPPWVQEGGYKAWAARLKDPTIRAKVKREMLTPTDAWENLLLASGPKGVLLVGFKNEALRKLIGKTLDEVAHDAQEVAARDGHGPGHRGRQPRPGRLFPDVGGEHPASGWFAVGRFSDLTPDRWRPRACSSSRARILAPMATVARLLGRYVRDQKATPMAEAIRRLTSFPAANLRISDRGALEAGLLC